MATKVYWLGLRLLIERTNKYIGKWSAQLSANLTTEQMEAVSELFVQNQVALGILPQPVLED